MPSSISRKQPELGRNRGDANAFFSHKIGKGHKKNTVTETLYKKTTDVKNLG